VEAIQSVRPRAEQTRLEYVIITVYVTVIIHTRMYIFRASKRNFTRRNKTALGPRDRKNSWKYRKNEKKNQYKTSMAKAIWGPSEIHRPLIGSPDPGPMYRLNPPLIGPVYITHLVCV